MASLGGCAFADPAFDERYFILALARGIVTKQYPAAMLVRGHDSLMLISLASCWDATVGDSSTRAHRPDNSNNKQKLRQTMETLISAQGPTGNKPRRLNHMIIAKCPDRYLCIGYGESLAMHEPLLVRDNGTSKGHGVRVSQPQEFKDFQAGGTPKKSGRLEASKGSRQNSHTATGQSSKVNVRVI